MQLSIRMCQLIFYFYFIICLFFSFTALTSENQHEYKGKCIDGAKSLYFHFRSFPHELKSSSMGRITDPLDHDDAKELFMWFHCSFLWTTLPSAVTMQKLFVVVPPLSRFFPNMKTLDVGGKGLLCYIKIKLEID